MEEQIVDTWRIHNRINLYMLEAIAPEALAARASPRGRSVGEQIAHLHNVRLMWIESGSPSLMSGLEKIGKEDAHDGAMLANALERSGEAVATMLAKALASKGRVKGFKPHATAFLGYMIAHESHHRGQIAMTLKSAGYPLDKKVSFGMWEWGVR